MSFIRVVGLRACASLLCVVMVLACAAPVAADPKPLTKEEQAKVDKAIDRAIALLKRTQTKQGDWPRLWPTQHVVGQCALPAYALLEAGVPADDPVIQRAADFLRALVLLNDRTYELSLALLFFDRLGDPKDKPLIRTLALRLIAGQHVTGGWNYGCIRVAKEREDLLVKALTELNTWQESGGKSRLKLLKGLHLPPSILTLAVFRDPSELPWQDPPESEVNERVMPIVGRTDNSNTQFAMLGLWAAQRHDVPVGPTCRLMTERFERTQMSNGWWPYFLDRNRAGDGVAHPSIICVGLIGLAIGRGMKPTTPAAPQPEKVDLPIIAGLAALSQDIGVAAAGLNHMASRGPYYLWSVERVAMLYDLPTIGDKDWYRWGAGILISSQNPGGEWRILSVSTNGRPLPYYGPILNTAFALLFLKRSHPMKELTPKLPFTAKELNQGIARMLADKKLPAQTTTTSRPSSEIP